MLFISLTKKKDLLILLDFVGERDLKTMVWTTPMDYYTQQIRKQLQEKNFLQPTILSGAHTLYTPQTQPTEEPNICKIT